MHIHKYKSIHAFIPTLIPIWSHQTHEWMHAYTKAYDHLDKYTQAITCMHAYSHIHKGMWSFRQIHSTQKYASAYIYRRIRTCIHTYVYSQSLRKHQDQKGSYEHQHCIHTHTYIHAHIHTYVPSLSANTNPDKAAINSSTSSTNNNNHLSAANSSIKSTNPSCKPSNSSSSSTSNSIGSDKQAAAAVVRTVSLPQTAARPLASLPPKTGLSTVCACVYLMYGRVECRPVVSLPPRWDRYVSVFVLFVDVCMYVCMHTDAYRHAYRHASKRANERVACVDTCPYLQVFVCVSVCHTCDV